MSMSALPDGLIAFGPSSNCTLELCPLEASILRYRPSITASSISIAIFGLSLILNLLQGFYYKTWGFMASLMSGCILEIVGYIGRIVININPFDFNGFLMQITKIILRVDERLSRIPPRYLYWIFILCDVTSLVLQAAGGALSCVGQDKADIQVGVDISLAGLIFQVATLTLFTALFVDYIYSCRRYSSHKVFMRPMNMFLSFLLLSMLLILIRCVYRVVELHDGYFSHFFRDEPLFIALESAIMCAAVICLNIGHPSLVFGPTKVQSTHGESEYSLPKLYSRSRQ